MLLHPAVSLFSIHSSTDHPRAINNQGWQTKAAGKLITTPVTFQIQSWDAEYSRIVVFFLFCIQSLQLPSGSQLTLCLDRCSVICALGCSPRFQSCHSLVFLLLVMFYSKILKWRCQQLLTENKQINKVKRFKQVTGPCVGKSTKTLYQVGTGTIRYGTTGAVYKRGFFYALFQKLQSFYSIQFCFTILANHCDFQGLWAGSFKSRWAWGCAGLQSKLRKA